MDVPKLGELRFSLTPPSVSLPPGGVYPVEVILERPSGFVQPVTVTVNGLPSGVTASPLSIAGNTGVFTLSASADARSPRTEAMVSAASPDGMLSASRTLALVVEAPDAGFSLALTPATITLSRGSTGATRVSVIRRSFSGAVTVTVSGLPRDGGIGVDPLSITGSQGTLVFRAASNATPGTSPLVVSGASDALRASAPLGLVVLDPGGLDETFGAQGETLCAVDGGAPIRGCVVTVLDAADAGTYLPAQTMAVALQPDGKIVVAGQRRLDASCGGPSDSCLAIAVSRYNSDGTLDQTFGASVDPADAGSGVLPPPGVAIVYEQRSSPTTTIGTPLALAFTDGGILVGVGSPPNTPQDSLIQLTSEGRLDRSFNPDAGGRPGSAPRTLHVKAIFTDTDGGVLVAGHHPYASPATALALARYNADGTLDTSFGDAGILAARFDAGGTVTAQGAIFNGENIKVVGSTQNQVGVMSFDINDGGSLDQLFNGSGQLQIPFGSVTVSTPKALVDVQGTAVAVGTAGAGAQAQIGMARFEADGGLDPLFGNGGIAITNLPTDAGIIQVAAAASFRDQIIAVGSIGARLLIARFNPDGGLDTAFGSRGTGYISDVPNLPGVTTRLFGVAVQPDGKIVAVGVTGNASRPQQQLVIRYQGSTAE